MATAGVTHHLRLSQSDGSTTEQGIMLARDRDRNLLYRAQRLPSLPLQDIWVEQKSWHRGFGDYLYRREDPYRYAYSDGVDCRFVGGAQLAPQASSKLDYLVRNGGAELGATTGWSADAGVTLTAPAAAAHSGSYGFRAVTNGSKGADTNLMRFTLVNPAVFQSMTIRAYAMVRRTAGSESGINLSLYDNIGAVNSSSTVTSSTFTAVTTGHTVSASGVTSIRIELRTTGVETGSHTYEIDDVILLVTTTGLDNVPRALVEYAGVIYMACGGVISVWNETDDVFEAVYIYSSTALNVTGLIPHAGYIYGALGTIYIHSNDTSDPRTTWTAVTPSAGAANLLSQALDAGGDIRLVRADTPNEVYISNESSQPVGAGNWATAFTAGETDKNITALHSAFDSILVGREDGLFYFYPPDNKFRSATDQFRVIQDAENFDVGSQFINGKFYTSMARLGLMSLSMEGGDFHFEQVSPSYLAGAYNAYGGRIRALTHDGMWFYGLHDNATADATATKTNALMAAQSDSQGGLTWHTLKNLAMSIPKGLIVESDYLWAFGQLYNSDQSVQVPIIYRMSLPTQHINPLKAATPALEASGTLVTSVMDMGDDGYGVDDKGLTKVVVYGDGVSAAKTITVEVQVDTAISDTGSWTAVGAAITSLTNGAATVSFTAGSGSTGKRFRLRFTLAATGASANVDSPILRGFRVYAVPHPDRYWAWDFTMRVSNTLAHLNGTSGAETAQNVMANMNTLDSQDFPLKLNDLDNTQYNAQIVSMEKVAVPGQGTRAGTSGEHLEQALHVVMREVLTS